jgi:O-antigen/teichoic acid export membrane protein
MNTVQRIAKNTAALFAAQAVTAVLGLVLSILIARTLGAAEFGKYSFSIVFTGLFAIFIELGYNTLLVREVARDISLAGKYFGNITGIRLTLSVIIFTAMAIIINIMHYPGDIKILVYLFGIQHIFSSFADIARVTFRAFQKMEYEMITLMVKEVVRVSLGITILLLGYGLMELALFFVFSGALDLLFSFFICGRKFVKPQIEVDPKFWKQTIKTALPLSAMTVFTLIYVKIDIVMLSMMKGDAVVGWYAAAYGLVLALKPFAQWFRQALLPLTSKFFVSSKSSLRLAYEKSFKYLLIVGLPMAVAITLLADRFILLFYGQAFENSIIALQILAWDVFLIYTYGPLGTTLVAIDKQNQLAAATGVSAFINIILNLILIPHFSYVGAAVATIITETALFGMYFYFVSKYLYRLPLHRMIVSPVISCVAMALFIHLCNEINLAALIVAAAMIYFMVLYLTKGLSPEDIVLLKQVIKVPNLKRD